MAHTFEEDGEVGSEMPPVDPGGRPPAELLVERLKGVLDGEGVISDAACRRYAVRGSVPLVVAKPADVEGISAVLGVASELRASVVPWGGGSRMTIGLPPRRCDVVLSLERLREVLEYDPADLTVSVQAGATHGELARTLAVSGQMLPLDVPLPGRATLGGTLATATAGLRRAYYGSPRDVVLGLRVVDARGTVLKTGGRVVKNVTGYDMSKLYIGALGTLGVIVEVHLKLTPRPEAEGTVMGIFAEAGDAFTAADSLDALGVRPSALTVASVAALPELAGLAPDHLDSTLLAARFPGPMSAVARAMREGMDSLTHGGARMTLRLEDDAQTMVWGALDNYSQCATSAEDGALVRISAQPSECVMLLDAALNHVRTSGGMSTWLADAATGTLWLRIRAREGEETERIASLGDVLESLRKVMRELGRAPAILVAPTALASRAALWEVSGGMYGLMRDIKNRFDPDGLLNPGRSVVG